jgi:hypothetical protein
MQTITLGHVGRKAGAPAGRAATAARLSEECANPGDGWAPVQGDRKVAVPGQRYCGVARPDSAGLSG